MAKRLTGLAHIRTAQRSGIRAKPKLSGTEHLDLFLLEKNRDRLQQEIQCVQERLERLAKDLQGIDEEIAKISSPNCAPAATAQRARNNKPPRTMKKMELPY